MAKPAHQVVFSAVDPETDIGEICLQVGLALSAQLSGSVCLVEADGMNPGWNRQLKELDSIWFPLKDRATVVVRHASSRTSCAGTKERISQ